ncbi:MAG: (2Fe-2S)-binding protein [Phycisphaera sp.]|nr:(2Fe-2S)-binding protein [Phycisphaera sp.]
MNQQPQPSPIRVDRCVCTQRTFTSLRDEAISRQTDTDTVASQCGAGQHCGLCKPYLREMQRTGVTVFHHLLPMDEPTRHTGAA